MEESWIKYGSFKFGTHDMYEEFGLRIVDCDYDYILPALRQSTKQIPKRSGVYRYEEKYYDERAIMLSVRAENESKRDYWREVSYALSTRNSIYIYDEPEKYYIGRIYDPSVFKRIRNIGMDLDLVFVCEPFAYRQTFTRFFVNNRFTLLIYHNFGKCNHLDTLKCYHYYYKLDFFYQTK